MWAFTDIRPAYTRAERYSDGVVHIVGVSLALVAVPVLITITAFHRTEPEAVLGVSIYGATLVLMLTFSALYNMIESERWSEVLRRLDHSGIYVKIAGTYTPFVLLSAGQAPGLLIGLWSSATIGSVLKLIDPGRFRWFGLVLYLMMGWAIVWAGQTMLSELSPTVIWLIVAGGVVYTAGVGFFLLERLPFHNTIWHVFVLAGSVLFFIAISVRILLLPHPVV